MRVKEFHSRKNDEGKLIGVGILVNSWLKENEDVQIFDIKYSANGFGSHALVIYKEREEEV